MPLEMLMAEAMTSTATAGASPETTGEVFAALFSLVAILWGAWAKFKAVRTAALLRAAITGVQAALDSLDAANRNLVKDKIKAEASAAGINEELKAEVRRTTSERVAAKDDGDGSPFPPRGVGGVGGVGVGTILPLLFVVLFLAAPGCLSASVADLAATQGVAVRHLRDTSVPDPSWITAMTGKLDRNGVPYTEERLRAIWAAEWDALERSSDAIGRASR